jgi:hypothetical protein
MRRAALALALLTTLTSGCRRGATAASARPAPGASSVSVPLQAGVPCGPLDCHQFDSPGEAFESILGAHPRVLAIGEAHAQAGTTVASSARHFTEEVLPVLVGRASDLLVELMNPPSGCAATTKTVRTQQQEVTRSQAPSNQSEYVAMGERARQLGIVPDLLRPGCDDLRAVEAAGDDAVDSSLAMIARLTRTQAERLVDRNARTPEDASKLVVIYGGALHNDPEPSPERAGWSFGPALASHVGGAYVAVDLYVPELFDGSERWTRLPFYAHYDPARLGARTTVYRQGKTFVVVLPRSSGHTDSTSG